LEKLQNEELYNLHSAPSISGKEGEKDRDKEKRNPVWGFVGKS
jgi:hypothetical protein